MSILIKGPQNGHNSNHLLFSQNTLNWNKYISFVFLDSWPERIWTFRLRILVTSMWLWISCPSGHSNQMIISAFYKWRILLYDFIWTGTVWNSLKYSEIISRFSSSRKQFLIHRYKYLLWNLIERPWMITWTRTILGKKSVEISLLLTNTIPFRIAWFVTTVIYPRRHQWTEIFPLETAVFKCSLPW